MEKTKTILVAPLNWGLGHASRCIPIIQQLIESNCKVILAADGQALQLLVSEFPDLDYEVLPGIKTSYSKFIPIPILMILRSPKLFKTIKKEHALVKKLIKKYKVDGIISDNRYGCYHKSIPSIIITHQIAIKTPFLKKRVQQVVEKLLAKFNYCWIPDLPGENNLSGELSHSPTKLKNIQFIGILSRFKKNDKKFNNYSRKLLILLSGPEPSRTTFEQQLVKQLHSFKEEVLIVRGKLGATVPKHQNSKVQFVAHLPTAELQNEIEQSELVLCRSGYSSLMDLCRMKKKVLLVPTSGQSEQEYLAKRLTKAGRCFSVKQSAMNIKNDLEKALEYQPLQLEEKEELLAPMIKNWLIEFNQQATY